MSRSRTAPASRRRFRRSSILSNPDRGYTRIEDGDARLVVEQVFYPGSSLSPRLVRTVLFNTLHHSMSVTSQDGTFPLTRHLTWSCPGSEQSTSSAQAAKRERSEQVSPFSAWRSSLKKLIPRMFATQSAAQLSFSAAEKRPIRPRRVARCR